jgi:hypothetical protein
MSKSRERTLPGGRPRTLILFALLTSALALTATLTAEAPGAGGATTIILGRTPVAPDASCPENPCRAVGRVTGFQIRNQEGRLPFRVPRNGRITAWTLTLSEPTDRQRAFFNGFFGRPPKAHLAILKRVPGSSPPRYRLLRQSRVRVLSAFLGSTVRFRLGNPLAVRRGNIVALSIPTWAPGFAFDLSQAEAWRASRQPGACTNANDLRDGRPQQVVGSRRTYGCRYETARLLYTATLVTGR